MRHILRHQGSHAKLYLVTIHTYPQRRLLFLRKNRQPPLQFSRQKHKNNIHINLFRGESMQPLPNS